MVVPLRNQLQDDAKKSGNSRIATLEKARNIAEIRARDRAIKENSPPAIAAKNKANQIAEYKKQGYTVEQEKGSIRFAYKEAEFVDYENQQTGQKQTGTYRKEEIAFNDEGQIIDRKIRGVYIKESRRNQYKDYDVYVQQDEDFKDGQLIKRQYFDAVGKRSGDFAKETIQQDKTKYYDAQGLREVNRAKEAPRKTTYKVKNGYLVGGGRKVALKRFDGNVSDAAAYLENRRTTQEQRELDNELRRQQVPYSERQGYLQDKKYQFVVQNKQVSRINTEFGTSSVVARQFYTPEQFEEANALQVAINERKRQKENDTSFENLVLPYQDQQSRPEYRDYSPVTTEFIYDADASDTGFERRIKAVGRAERELSRDINTRLPAFLKPGQKDGLFIGAAKNQGAGLYLIGSDAVNLVKNTNPISQIIRKSQGKKSDYNILTARSLLLTGRKTLLYGEAAARSPFNKNIRKGFTTSTKEQFTYLGTDTYNLKSPVGLSNVITAGVGAGIVTAIKFRPVNRIQNQPVPDSIKVSGITQTKGDTFGAPLNIGAKTTYGIEYTTGTGKNTIATTILKTKRGGYIKQSTLGKTTIKTIVDPKKNTQTSYIFKSGKFQKSQTAPFKASGTNLQAFEELFVTKTKASPVLRNQGTTLLQEVKKQSAFNVRGNVQGVGFEGTILQETQAKSASRIGAGYVKIESPNTFVLDPTFPKLGVAGKKAAATPLFQTENVGNTVTTQKRAPIYTRFGYQTRFAGDLNRIQPSARTKVISSSMLASKKAQFGATRLITQYTSPLDIGSTKFNIYVPAIGTGSSNVGLSTATSFAFYSSTYTGRRNIIGNDRETSLDRFRINSNKQDNIVRNDQALEPLSIQKGSSVQRALDDIQNIKRPNINRNTYIRPETIPPLTINDSIGIPLNFKTTPGTPKTPFLPPFDLSSGQSTRKRKRRLQGVNFGYTGSLASIASNRKAFKGYKPGRISVASGLGLRL